MDGTLVATIGTMSAMTQITWVFWTMIFLNLKNSHQDLYNEGSKFILRSLEVTQT